MQPKGYIKDINWLGNPYRHTILKCSMKVYLKVIGCSCYTCLPQTAHAAAQTDLKMDAAPSTGTGLLRWINVYSRTHGQKQGTT